MKKLFTAIVAIVCLLASLNQSEAWFRRGSSGGATPQQSQNLAGTSTIWEARPADSAWWLGSTLYSTKSDFIAAVPTCADSGSMLWICSGAVVGSELLTNPDFTSNTTGWTPSANVSIASVAGEMEMTATAASAPDFHQSFTTAAGKAYLFSGFARRGTFSSSVGIAAWQGAGTAFLGQVSTSNTTPTALSYTAGSATSTMQMAGRSTGTGSGTSYFDTFSVKETLPFPTFTQGNYSAYVTATTPASVTTPQVLAYFGNDSPTNSRTRIEYRSDHSLWLIANTNLAVASNNLGTVAPSTSFTVHISESQGAIWGLLVGGFVKYNGNDVSTSPTPPATGIFRLGSSPAGEAWTGTIQSAGIFPGPDVPRNAVATWGDSFMQGTPNPPGYLNGLNDYLPVAPVNRTGLFSGGGGYWVGHERCQIFGGIWTGPEDASGSCSIAMGSPPINQAWRPMVTIGWDGGANGYTSLDPYLDIMQSIFDAQSTDHFIVLQEIKPPGNPANWARSDAIAAGMLARWGTTHFYNWNQCLSTNPDGTPEIQWMRWINANTIVPGERYWIRSVGTTDFTTVGAASNTVGINFVATGTPTGTGQVVEYAEAHLGDTGMAAMAVCLSAKITANGWDNLYGAQLNWLLKRDLDPASNDNEPMWLEKAA